jgi:DNA-binding response OmpR family regulator
MNPILSSNSLTLNYQTFEVLEDGESINLTPYEFGILKILLMNKNQIITRDKILNSVWGYLYEVGERTVDIQISKLRRKLKKNKDRIVSIRGYGYKFAEASK